MAFGYTPKRSRNLYTPDSKGPFKLSRSRLENFTKCARCFYIDRKLGMDRPPGFPFSLNSAVDGLLKKEFDIHRMQQSKHPIMEQYGVDAVPFEHEKINEWRENFVGVQYLHEPTNLLITGAIDDVWVDPDGNLIVVDYKATAKQGEVSLDAPWQDSYKRQMEIYQWLLRKNGFSVSDTGYFVYVNGKMDEEAFDAKLEFDVKLIPYKGSDAWVEDAITRAHETLNSDTIPEAAHDCEYCQYRAAIKEVEK